MARSLSNVNAKALVSLFAENVSIALNRRGYAAAATQLANTVRGKGRMGKPAGKDESAEKSWVPDPVTGYYRPANRGEEIDVAELREIFLNQKRSQ